MTAPMVDRSAEHPVRWAASQLSAAGIEMPLLEAQLLLAIALGISRTAVVAELYAPLTELQWQTFAASVRARVDRTPLAYLRGYQEFYGLPFAVGPDVLIPRPETELLVDIGIEATRQSGRRSTGRRVLCDIGTGAGCIAIALLVNNAIERAVGLDLSCAALAVAYRNACALGIAERLRLVRSDQLFGIRPDKFDLIVANPPYIPTSEIPALQPEVSRYEPRLALDGGPDGLDAYRRLVPSARSCLAPGGTLAVEVGVGQSQSVADLFERAGFPSVEVRSDLAGIQRAVFAQLPD